jgi:hypothetical protein
MPAAVVTIEAEVRDLGHPPWAERFARHGLDLAALLVEG